jgi:Uma2 family endonuclease
MSMSLPTAFDYDEDALEQAMAHLVTEDDVPVDNRYSERQQRILPDILFASWPQGKPFEALSNVGLFTSLTAPPVVPDFMLSLGVQPRPVSSKKADRSYMTWVYGKSPDLVIEVVSNKEGGELDHKLQAYAAAGVPFYVVFDPFLKLGERQLRTFCLTGKQYTEAVSARWLPDIGLGLTLWEGTINDVHDHWLRFIDAEGRLLPTPEEGRALAEQERADAEREWAEAEQRLTEAEQKRTEAEQKQAEAEQRRTEAEQRRTEAEQRRTEAEQTTAQARQEAASARREAEEAGQRAERLAQQLRALGLDPDEG